MHGQMHEIQCLFRLLYLGGGEFIPPKHTIPPQTAAKLCALNLFFCRYIELQIYHGNFLLMDNKHRKLFVIKQSEGCTFMPRMYQNTFCNRAVPGPAGEAYALPQASRNGILLLRGGIEEEGPAYRGREGRREGTKREGKGIPPPKSR